MTSLRSYKNCYLILDNYEVVLSVFFLLNIYEIARNYIVQSKLILFKKIIKSINLKFYCPIKSGGFENEFVLCDHGIF
jgi:hypothetical protein